MSFSNRSGVHLYNCTNVNAILSHPFLTASVLAAASRHSGDCMLAVRTASLGLKFEAWQWGRQSGRGLAPTTLDQRS